VKQIATENKQKTPQKQLSPEEVKSRIKEKVRSSLFQLSKMEEEHREELTFILSMFDSIYTGSNPNFFQLFKERLIQESGSKE